MSAATPTSADGPQPILPFRRVLVTGGGGFVGRHLLPRLRAALAPDARVWSAGRDSDSWSDPGLGFVPFDLADAASIEAAIAGASPDLVIHLAGEASVGAAAAAAERTWRLNAVGALDIARALGRHAPEAMLFNVSSAEVYGRAFLTGLVSETCDPVPNSVYGQSKLAAEQILSETMPPAAPLVTVRPSNHIGPGQDRRFAMSSFAAQIVAAERLGAPSTIRVGNLASRRDFMDVRDVVAAYLALLARPCAPGARLTMNIASGETRSVHSLLDQMRAQATEKTVVEIDQNRFRPDDIPIAEVDSSRFRDATGWAPTIAIERTIADVLSDWRARPGE